MGDRIHSGHDWMESIAIGASLLCLVHCLILPVAVALLPALAAFVALPEALHIWLLGFVAPVAGLVLLSGYRVHRDHRPPVAGALGLVLLAFATLFFPETVLDMLLSTVGSVLLVRAHLLNWTCRHGCRR
ncbi:MAG: MerC domain-containing protein [Parasphingopyxis sp.]|uniref:MerC domain-containing protein n=1 Tax=Parasphingopyxis sp. TaxID=1920299 RepID=UPI003F9F2D21